MRFLLRNLLVIMLLTGAGRTHAGSILSDPKTEVAMGAQESAVAPLTVEPANEEPAPALDAPLEKAVGSSPHVQFRLRPVRISLKALLDRITIVDVLDAMSGL